MGLDKLRAEIDQLDHQIVKLINERYLHVLEVGKWKKQNNRAIYVPEREKALLRRLSEANNGPMTNETLGAIYREIMSGALNLEHPLRVNYFGAEGSFTHQAALAKFGHSVEYSSSGAICGVFKDVETGRVDYGCVPVENSTEGAVNYTLDTMVMSSVSICAEMNLPIHHNLMANCSFDQIKRVYSHAQILGQCRLYLQEHMAGVDQIETGNSTKAASIVAAEDGSAAIGSTLAAELFGLNILSERIEDFSNNTTRFLIVGKQKTAPTGDDKTSICFAIKDAVGALYDCIKPFKEEQITMTMIQSRPMKNTNWEYCFFIDILGHQEDEDIQRAFEALKHRCSFFKILGSYPRNAG